MVKNKTLYQTKRMITFLGGILIFVLGIRWLMAALPTIINFRIVMGPLGWMYAMPYFIGIIIGAMLMYKGIKMRFEE